MGVPVRAAIAALLLGLGAAAGCTNDYGQFDGNPNGTAGAGGAGVGGSTQQTKMCEGKEVSTNDPAFGCASPSCAPCLIENGTPACVQGVCTAESCNDGFGDCNNDPSDGCETNTQSDAANCGACNNDCSQQGNSTGFECAQGACGCGQRSHCRSGGTGTAQCSNRVCSCQGDRCVPGEACLRVAGRQRCRCNGGDACEAGETCCPTAGCVSLQSDSGHCGGCGRVCPTGQQCTAGACG